MNCKILVLTALLGISASISAATVATGSCMAKAASISSAGATATIRLVNEYDPDLKENLDVGVYYLKTTLRKGVEYTIWIEGGNSADLWLDVYTDWNDDNAPFAAFTTDTFMGGTVQAAMLYAEDWAEDDPASGTYYIVISGEIGDTAVLRTRPAIVSFTQIGEEGNPKPIAVSTARQSDGFSPIDGEFYYKATLEGGRKYRFATVGGTVDAPLDIRFDSYDDEVTVPQPEEDPTTTNDVYNTAVYFYPETTAEYEICVTAPWGETGSFQLAYQTYPSRRAKEHPNVVDLTEENAYTVQIAPGRLVADRDYYDPIIDESLARLYARTGERWAFETSGAATNLMMRVTKSGTTQLAENLTVGGGSFDVRTVVDYTEDANYYVGVCRYPALGPDDAKPKGSVTLTARRVDQLTGADYLDAWDRNPAAEGDQGDDVYTGASPLVAYPAAAASDVLKVGSVHGPHVLSVNDLEDWFALPCRKSLVYVLKAEFADPETPPPGLRLAADLFRLDNGALVPMTDYAGTLTPVSTETDVKGNFVFRVDVNGMYYVRVRVAEGRGLDFPKYNVRAMAYGLDATKPLGLLNVVTKGAETTWRLAEDLEGYFESGATVVADALPDGSTFKLKPTAVAGYVAADVRTNAVAWTGDEDSVTKVVLRYDDVADPDDCEVAGNTWLDVVQKENKAKRTLWEDDLRDHFAFKGRLGYYYNFTLEDKTEDAYGPGDAQFAIYPRGDETPIVEKMTGKVARLAFPAEGKYDLVVTHADDPARYGKYFLRYSCVNVGTVQFSQTSYTVTEDAAYAELTLTRTSSEGALGVYFATQVKTDSDSEFQAKPGSEYYPTNGLVAWADGDSTPKTVRVRLIPDLTAEWDNSKKFNVRIWPRENDELAEGEYRAIIAQDTATVKITESAEKRPGTVAVVNQPLEVEAGEVLTVRVARRHGDDGRIAVKMKTLVNDDVHDGVEIRYVETNLVWEADEAGTKEVQVQTLKAGALEDKWFNCKFTALTTDEYADCDVPAIEAVKVKATIRSELVQETVEDMSAKTSAAGASLSYTGSWYVNGGLLRSDAIPAGANAKMRFVVTGPGFLFVQPQILGGSATGTYQIGSQPAKSMDALQDGEPLFIPAGEQSVMFKIKDGDGNAYLEFDDVGNGLPSKWLPFDSVRPVAPCDQAVARAANPATLSWCAPSGLTGGEQVWYRVRMGSSASVLSVVDAVPQATELKLGAGALAVGRKYYWTLDFAFGAANPSADDWHAGPTVWSFSTAVAGAPRTGVPAGNYDAAGNAVVGGTNVVELVKGVLASIPLVDEDAGEVTGLELVAGELPPGMALKQSIKKIKGTPTSLGDFFALVRVVRGSIGGTTLAFNFRVSSLTSAAGNFTGVLRVDGDSAANGLSRIGLLNVSATTKGVLSAKATVGGRDLSFSGKNFDEVTDWDGETATKRAKSTMTVSETLSGVACTHTLELDVASGEKTDAVAMGASAGTARLTLVGADGVECVYVCELVRQCAVDVPAYKEAMKPFAGYYTVSLVPGVIRTGWPTGNGYLTLTVGEDASVRAAGRLADGSEVSLATVAQLRGDLEDPENCTLQVPLAVAVGGVPAPYSFGGVLSIRYGAPVDVDGRPACSSFVDSLQELEWNKDSKYSTFDNLGFTLPIRPTGGWYNTEFNLQRYYLDSDLTVEAGALDGLPAGMLPDGAYTVDTTPHGAQVVLEGDALSVPTANRERETANPDRYDFAASVNPWKTKVNFVRATGLVSGTFQEWTDDGVKQTNLGLLNHYGVLLMNRDLFSPLDVDVWTAGFFVVPINSKRVYSFPFNIRSAEAARDWSEMPIPEVGK